MSGGVGKPRAEACPWLLRQRIAIPERIDGYLHRAGLVDRAMPTRRRLTVLRAAAGFGKTVLLAECCRRLRARGVAAAWLSLDEHDTAATLDVYVAFACMDAGLELLEDSSGEETVAPANRAAAVLLAIQALGRPFVLAVDELERLADRDAVAVLRFLLERGPSNLHLAFACRGIPASLDVARRVLEGSAAILESGDLRFSRPDVARYFGLALSPRALSEEMDRTGGWPLALRASRNGAGRGARTEQAEGLADGLIGNWIESRLFANLGPDDRDLVLDLGLFGWIDAPLLDETLPSSGAMRRVRAIGALEGLLERVGTGTVDGWRLHPMVREYCAAQRFREDPERFRALHRRIAGALATRGETVSGMRHAVRGGDPVLAGEILERAGGVRFWSRQGVAQFLEADRLLPESVVGASPRLRLVRCMALTLSGAASAARTMYARRPRPEDPADSDGAGFEYLVDDCAVRFGMGLYGGESVGADWMTRVLRDTDRLSRSAHLGPAERADFEYALAVGHFLAGDFGPALERLAVARLAGSPYIALYGEVMRGQVDFYRGRPGEAESHFRRAHRMARKRFALDPVAMTACEIARCELDLERGSASNAAAPPAGRADLTGRGVPFSFFATAGTLMVESSLRFGRVAEALAATGELVARVRLADFSAFERLAAAWRTSVLVESGRVAEAERTWVRHGLPADTPGCVDRASQSWRELEAVSEARVRLLVALGRHGEARSLIRAFLEVAAEPEFRKTRLRALALSVALERRAGETVAAERRLTQYLDLFAKTAYAWPLVRERETCADLLRTFAESSPACSRTRNARSLLAAMGRLDGGGPALSEREREVLRLLEGRRVKEVGDLLGLSVHGVRYHLRGLFRKLAVSSRAELVQRGRELGVVPD